MTEALAKRLLGRKRKRSKRLLLIKLRRNLLFRKKISSRLKPKLMPRRSSRKNPSTRFVCTRESNLLLTKRLGAWSRSGRENTSSSTATRPGSFTAMALPFSRRISSSSPNLQSKLSSSRCLPEISRFPSHREPRRLGGRGEEILRIPITNFQDPARILGLLLFLLVSHTRLLQDRLEAHRILSVGSNRVKDRIFLLVSFLLPKSPRDPEDLLPKRSPELLLVLLAQNDRGNFKIRKGLEAAP